MHILLVKRKCLCNLAGEKKNPSESNSSNPPPQKSNGPPLKARLQELRRRKQVKIKCTVITSIMLRLIHIDKYSMEQGIKSVHLTYLN